MVTAAHRSNNHTVFITGTKKLVDTHPASNAKDLHPALMHVLSTELTGHPFLLFLNTEETTCILNQLQQKPSKELTQQFPMKL